MIMRGYLLDTNIASAAILEDHGFHEKVRNWLDSVGKNHLFISAVSIAEVEFGLSLNPLPVNVEKEIRQGLSDYTPLFVDKHTLPIYGKIRADILKKYAPKKHNRITQKVLENLRDLTSGKLLGIQENDLWIVSVAVQHNLEFVTTDRGGGMSKIVDVANYDQRTIYLT